jgi:hypothetical protein
MHAHTDCTAWNSSANRAQSAEQYGWLFLVGVVIASKPGLKLGQSTESSPQRAGANYFLYSARFLSEQRPWPEPAW